MRRFAKFLLMLGMLGTPLPALAQYPPPVYFGARPLPAYTGPYTHYSPGWQSRPISYPYGYQHPQSWPAAQYPHPAQYGTPVLLPAPSLPPAYTVSSSQYQDSPAMPPKAPAPKALAPVTTVGAGADNTISEKSGEPVPPESPKQIDVPDVIAVQPPQHMPAAIDPPGVGTKYTAVETESAGTNGPSHCPNCKNQRFFVFGEFLYMTVRGADIPYAQAFDGVGPLAVPRGPVAVADPDYHPAVRAGGGVALGDGRWLQGAFTFFESDTRDRIAAIPGTAIRSYLTFPATLNSAFTSLEASARYDIDLFMGEVDYKAPLCSYPNVTVNYLVGVRYAHLDESLTSTFDLLGTTNVDSTINFDGVGPRFGLEGEAYGRSGLFGYGRGVFNLLVGHFNANYEQQNVFTGLQAQTEIGDDRVVPVLEFEIGGGWISSNGHVRLSGGYYIGTWFNTLTTNSLVRGVQATDFTTNGDNFRDTLTFDGIVGRVEFRY